MLSENDCHKLSLADLCFAFLVDASGVVSLLLVLVLVSLKVSNGKPSRLPGPKLTGGCVTGRFVGTSEGEGAFDEGFGPLWGIGADMNSW